MIRVEAGRRPESKRQISRDARERRRSQVPCRNDISGKTNFGLVTVPQMVDGNAVDESPDCLSILVKNGKECRNICTVLESALNMASPTTYQVSSRVIGQR